MTSRSWWIKDSGFDEAKALRMKGERSSPLDMAEERRIKSSFSVELVAPLATAEGFRLSFVDCMVWELTPSEAEEI